MKTPGGLYIDQPSWPLLQANISYWDVSDANGAATGLTIVCGNLGNEPSYRGQLVKPITGNAAGQVRRISMHPAGTNTLTVSSPFTDNTGAVVQIVAGTQFVIISIDGDSGLDGIPPLSAASLLETWADPAVGISAARWTPTNPATGLAWARTVAGAFIYAQTVPNANEVARLRSNQQWRAHTTSLLPRIVPQKLILEFEMLLGNVANIDNAIFICGLTQGVGDTRATNNIIGWGLVGDALQTITDLAGAETVNTGFGETLTQINKFRISVTDTEVRFSLNEAIIATHVTNLPDGPFYLNFYIDTEAGGAATLALGWIAAWFNSMTK